MTVLIRTRRIAGPLLGLLVSVAMPSVALRAQPAIAMHGVPTLPADATAFPYVNPDAPKGGTLKLCFLGTFDSLNPFNLKAGSTAQGLINLVFEPLMTRSLDEPFSLYGLVARSLDTDDDRSFVAFHIDPRARFSDGTTITAADVLFTFNLLKAKGRPQQRAAYGLVKQVAITDPLTIRFDLSGLGDRELPLFLALMPVLSERNTDAARFDETSLAPRWQAAPIG